MKTPIFADFLNIKVKAMKTLGRNLTADAVKPLELAWITPITALGTVSY